MENYYTLKEKISSLVGQQELQITNISEQDEVLLETGNPNIFNKLVFENDDTIILEENSFASAFTLGETVTGSITGASATILSSDTPNGKLFISANSRFRTGETIIGTNSGATATVGRYRANPVQNIQQLLNYADADKTIYDFLSSMRLSFMQGITENLNEDVDKRKLVKNIKDLYRAKGTAKANKLFFQMLFNETPDIVTKSSALYNEPSLVTERVFNIVLTVPFATSVLSVLSIAVKAAPCINVPSTVSGFNSNS